MFNFENKRKMKKIVLVCIVAIMATAAQAQIYVGGTLGFSSVNTAKGSNISYSLFCCVSGN